MSDRESVINEQQRQIEELEERLAIVLEGQPEVVRCGECIYRRHDGYCEYNYLGERKLDWFCADGRRED